MKIQFNKELEDDDYLLNEFGWYLLYGVVEKEVQTILYSEFIGEGKELAEGYYPLSDRVKCLGLHYTSNGDALDAQDLNDHGLVTGDQLDKSKKLMGTLVSKHPERFESGSLCLSFTIVKETEEEIRKSPILFFTDSLEKKEAGKVKYSSYGQLLSTHSLYLVRIVSEATPLDKLQSNPSSIHFTGKGSFIAASKSKKFSDLSLISQASQNTVTINPLFQLTNTDNGDSLSSPFISLSVSSTNAVVTGDISELCVVSKDQDLESCVSLFRRSIGRAAKNSAKKTLHFTLASLCLPITGHFECSKSGEVDDSLPANKSVRVAMHRALGLHPARPLLRLANAVEIGAPPAKVNPKECTTRIRDVHTHLDMESKVGGVVSTVQGPYDYYHYMQDGIDDNGWGCAYRSMQTICSYIRLQGLTQKLIPNHREIQSMLVAMKDKESSFIGSKQWIGAFEITLCLQQLYGIDSKILNIKSGSEVVEKVRELARHFQTQGTPVMIGGGVLAYTLLGVDYNESTGDARYLILDPHYTGTDTIQTIKEKGWCGWKGGNLFLKNHFYNFCMPQIPQEI